MISARVLYTLYKNVHGVRPKNNGIFIATQVTNVCCTEVLLGTFSKFRKANISFVISIRYLSFLKKSVDKIQV
jgi:hypothetical protein